MANMFGARLAAPDRGRIRQGIPMHRSALLTCAALVYLLIGSFEDTVLLSGFIALSIGITIYQERKSERAIDALKDLSSPRALVKRDGESRRIPSREVVVGDLLILEEGNRITADATILTCNDLLVVRGGGSAVVQAIGLQTEIGKIGKSLKQIVLVQSPLQRDIRTLIRRFAIFGVTLSLVVCIIYGVFYSKWLDGVLAGITLIMALLPEEFAVILTVFMALGVWRISRQQVLTRSAPVIETLGSITTLCVDKTGTLTLNKMSLTTLATADDPDSTQALSEPFDPMEQAFHTSMQALSPDHIATYFQFCRGWDFLQSLRACYWAADAGVSANVCYDRCIWSVDFRQFATGRHQSIKE